MQLSLPVKPHHHLWLGWIHGFLNKKKKAHKAYEDGIAACSVNDGLAFELRMAQIELYTEEHDWDGCWKALVVALNTWPTVPDLYARAGLTILRRDYATNPVAALQGALIWYRPASELAPTNSYYPLCISRVNEQLSRVVHVPDPSMLETDGTPPVMPPFSPPPPSPPNNFLDFHSRNSMSSALTYSEYGHVLPPSQRQFVGMEEVLNCQSPLPQQSRPQVLHYIRIVQKRRRLR